MYKTYTLEQLWQTYNAILAGAWPGNENEVMDEIQRRGSL